MDKSRNLNLKEYLHNLQLEYVSAWVRATINTKQKNIDFWKKLMYLKAPKITDVAQKVKITNTVLSDSSTFYQYLEQVCPIGKEINLSYKSYDDVVEYKPKEKKLYYAIDSIVSVIEHNKITPKIGTIINVDLVKEKVDIKLHPIGSGSTLSGLTFSQIRRIFSYQPDSQI